MAKLSPGTVVEGVSKRVLSEDGDIVRYKIKFKHNSEIESGWISRDFITNANGGDSGAGSEEGHIEECFLSFSCLEGKLEQYQNHKEMADDDNMVKQILKQVTLAAILHAPISKINLWLDTICCHTSNLPIVTTGLNETTTSSLIETNPWSSIIKSSNNGGGVCGYLFKRGDMAWNCRTCQSDATCVQCDECFRRSDHKGHDVFFHATSPGI